MCIFLGAVPVPESLLFSEIPLVPLKYISSEHLLESVSPAGMEELRRTCQGSMQCVYDTLASSSSDLGLWTLDARAQYQNLALIYGSILHYFGKVFLCDLLTCTNWMWSFCRLAGNMPPIVTDPTVISCKVNSTVNIKINAQDPNGDPITYSLFYPRPPRTSIGSGGTHTYSFYPKKTISHTVPMAVLCKVVEVCASFAVIYSLCFPHQVTAL